MASAFNQLVDQLAAIEFAEGPVMAKALHLTDEAEAEAHLLRWGKTPRPAVREALRAYRRFRETGFRLPTRREVQRIAAARPARDMRQMAGEIRRLAKAMPKPQARTPRPSRAETLAREILAARVVLAAEVAAGRLTPTMAYCANRKLDSIRSRSVS